VRLCKVTGTVYGEAKHPDYRGMKLLVVQPLTPDGRLKGTSLLAVDTARAGVGDTVLVMSEGNGVRQIFRREKLAIRSVIVGVVDHVDFHPDPV
jgi:microcompartment protein CcmK/EutM